MEISQKLKILREEHKLTQDELATKLKLSRSAISNYESGLRTPEINTLYAICNFYNITLDSLFSEETEYKVTKKKNHNKILYILLFTLILSMLLVIIIPNINNNSIYTYGYDINNDELKVKNCDEISIIKFTKSIDKNTYEIETYNALKGGSVNYVTIKNKDIDINKDNYYMIFGNRIKFIDKNNNYASIDHLEIYDHQFIYELDDYNHISLIDNQVGNSKNLIDYYSYYINNEPPKDVLTFSIDNFRDEEVVISSKDPYENHYDEIDLYSSGCLVNELNRKGYKYVDVSLELKVSINSKLNVVSYLYNNKTNSESNKIATYKITKYKLYNYNHSNLMINYLNIPLSHLCMYEGRLIIRYGYDSIFNSSWTNSNLSINMEFKK